MSIEILSIRGYTRSAWDVATTVRLSRPQTSHQRDKTSSPKGSVTLTYIGPTTEAILRNIRKTGVQVHIRPTKIIRSKIIHPKYPVDKLDKAGLVQKIECNKCLEAYVAEIGRKLKDRFINNT